MLGPACGDALGSAVEFKPRGTFDPLTEMVASAVHNLPPGYLTDGTSMALCLAESLISKNGKDLADQLTRYGRWWQEDHLSSTGRCFDIGNTTRLALGECDRTRDPCSGPSDPRQAGNGSIMRLAPIPLFFAPNMEAAIGNSAESSRTPPTARRGRGRLPAPRFEASALLAVNLGEDPDTTGAVYGQPPAPTTESPAFRRVGARSSGSGRKSKLRRRATVKRPGNRT